MPVPSEKQHSILLILFTKFGTGFLQKARAVPVPTCADTGSKNKSLCRVDQNDWRSGGSEAMPLLCLTNQDMAQVVSAARQPFQTIEKGISRPKVR